MTDYTEALEVVAKSRTAKRFIAYLEELERSLVDIRNIENPTTEELIGRKRAADILREGLIIKLKVLGGTITPPDTKEYI